MKNGADDQTFCLLTLLILIEPLNIIILTKGNLKMPETVKLDLLRVIVPDYSIIGASYLRDYERFARIAKHSIILHFFSLFFWLIK